MANSPFQMKIGMLVASVVLMFLSFSIFLATAVPQGAEITSNSTGTAASTSPENRTDARATITELVLNTIQQDNHWKGYVGNVTGRLSLDDADGYTIYDWEFGNLTISGEVYASRTNSPDWTTVECANTTDISTEETFHNMTGSDADSISNTFNYTLHDAFIVGSSGGPNSITGDSCASTAMYVNDTRQAMAAAGSTYFQEIILKDANDALLWTTLLEDDYDSYRTIGGHTYDFQMIVPESDIKTNPTTYYFYLEIG